MTVRAILALTLLNAAYLGVGESLLWSLRGFRSWSELVRLAGLAYLLGVAAFGIIWTELLVVGIPFGGAAIVLSLAALVAAGVALGRVRGMPAPRVGPRPSTPTAVLLVTAAGVALTGLLLEAFFRSARLQSLQAYDAWAFWVPKAKAIYLFGDLDHQVFTTAAGPSYPPLVPILDAAAFHAMGSADIVTLHLQYWFLLVGAVAAIAGCLHRHARPWLLWPPLLLALVVPRFGERLLAPQADMLVDALFVVAAVLLALWVRDARGWRLAVATTLLAGATLTKREGLYFAACAFLLALLAAGGRRRSLRPVLGSAAVVLVLAVPWRIWYEHLGIGGEAPPGRGLEGSAGRAADALRLSLDVLFDTTLWSIVPVVALIAVAVSLAAGDRLLACFSGGLLALVFVGGAWVTFSFPDLPITADEAVNPIVRYTGAVVLLGASLAPLLLESAWRGRGSEVES